MSQAHTGWTFWTVTAAAVLWLLATRVNSRSEPSLGRVSELWKARMDNRVVWRNRFRQLRTLVAINDDPAAAVPTSNELQNFTRNYAPASVVGQLQNGTIQLQNGTTQQHGEGEDYPEMVISESDLAEAAVGRPRGFGSNRRSVFEQNVVFRFYHDGQLTKTTTIESRPLLTDTQCSTTEKFALIVHGWHENCYETFWVKDLRDNLNTHRGGCVICMDYSIFASNGYTYLFRRFNDLSSVLLQFLRTLQYEGLHWENLYMFGFSFGGQLVLDAGNEIGFGAIDAIDTCDMAGVGFDQDRYFKGTNFRNAAKNVQCIHTSTDKGTKLMDKCHQDWRMGQCGFRQPAAGRPPLGSHGLCPVFYNLAFKVGYYAEPKPSECGVLRDPAAEYPKGYKMGYLENRKSDVRGELYAHTTDQYPYNMFNNNL